MSRMRSMYLTFGAVDVPVVVPPSLGGCDGPNLVPPAVGGTTGRSDLSGTPGGTALIGPVDFGNGWFGYAAQGGLASCTDTLWTGDGPYVPYPSAGQAWGCLKFPAPSTGMYCVSIEIQWTPYHEPDDVTECVLDFSGESFIGPGTTRGNYTILAATVVPASDAYALYTASSTYVIAGERIVINAVVQNGEMNVRNVRIVKVS